jgi:predicted PurR-regulated permease PerM
MYFFIPPVYIFCAVLIGYFGRKRKMGFWGYFFATLLLTPFVGIILLLVTEKVKPEDDDEVEEES